MALKPLIYYAQAFQKAVQGDQGKIEAVLRTYVRTHQREFGESPRKAFLSAVGDYNFFLNLRGEEPAYSLPCHKDGKDMKVPANEGLLPQALEQLAQKAEGISPQQKAYLTVARELGLR